jgi:8-oxo-dGTP diphosphatase
MPGWAGALSVARCGGVFPGFRPKPAAGQEVAVSSKKRSRFTYEFPRPALTVDVCLVSHDKRSSVLLIERQSPPFESCWALPGGFVDEGETLADAARREVKEETGLVIGELEQLYTAGDPGRDPRGWTVSVVYLVQVDAKRMKPKAGDDAKRVKWFPLDDLPKLAFDHAMILDRAKARLRERAE